MVRLSWLPLGIALVLQANAASSLSYWPSSYSAPRRIPNDPTATSAQPQLVISDSVLVRIYLALCIPSGDHRPGKYTPGVSCPILHLFTCYAVLTVLWNNDAQNPHLLPSRASDESLLQAMFNNMAIAKTTAKFFWLSMLEQGPAFSVFICQQFKISSTCNTTYTATTLGSVLTQVFANADAEGFFLLSAPANRFRLIRSPPARLNTCYSRDTESNVAPIRYKSDQNLALIHPSYATGTEANSTSGLCCRTNNFKTASPNEIVPQAPRYALKAILMLTGTQYSGSGWTIYTGDLDPENELSRWPLLYLYDLFNRTLGSGPVYAVLGNHDSYNRAQDAPHSLGVLPVWIMGHVLSGWDGVGLIHWSHQVICLTSSMISLSNIFSGASVNRYSPHVIENMFFGHTHEFFRQIQIFYATNTFDVLYAHTWRSDIHSYRTLDGQTAFGPIYDYEYSTRAVYGTNITWGPNGLLNATWWHLVTENASPHALLVPATAMRLF
ncbi:hypothetical protein BJV74DRAFT_896690 [Russula compacta]|nr:hypothetical protein BJV74DRAFT_896690 [Russula compacta]